MKKSWTYKCKNFIVGLLALIVICILAMTMYEVFSSTSKSDNIIIALIVVLGSIVTVLGGFGTILLHHERKKGPKNEI